MDYWGVAKIWQKGANNFFSRFRHAAPRKAMRFAKGGSAVCSPDYFFKWCVLEYI